MADASNRNAVVTGAAGGMGRAITKALVESGRHMFTETLRGELAETAIRVTEMQPGLTRTNIILTRYRGDREKEKDYFDQFKMALDPADIARSIAFAQDQPPHVQIAEMMILPVSRY